jgi:signal transduction histidine kinase
VISFVLPKHIRGSFGAKLVIIMVVLLSLLFLLFNLFLHQSQSSSHHQHLVKTGTAMARMLAESIMVEVFAEDIEELKSHVNAVSHLDHVLGVAVFNYQNELLYYLKKKEYPEESPGWQEMLKVSGNAPTPLTKTKDAFVFRHSILDAIPPGNEEGLYYRNDGHEASVPEIGYVALAFSPERDQAIIQNALSHAVFSSLVLFLLGVSLTYLIVRRMTYPLSSLLRKVRGSIHRQDNTDDFDLLSKTFDAQFNELQDTFAIISTLKEELESKNRELGVDIARRKVVEETLRKRDHILATVNHATEKLLESHEWIPFIKEMVDELGDVLNVGAIRIFKHNIDASGDFVADRQYDWIAEEMKANIGNLERRKLSYKKLGFERFLERFEKGEMVSGNSVDMAPPVKSWLEDHSVKSIAFAPIMVDSICWGFISLEMFDREQSWTEPELDALQTAARIIGAAVHREKITKELENKRAQLAHAGRLTAMGEMASGMAHEINQPLTVINLSADACTTYFNRNFPDVPEAEAAKDISAQVKKIARIVENMRIFSRRSLDEMSLVNLAYPVYDALTFFRVQLREHQVELREDISENLPEVKTDRQKFEQIVVNFLSNARYAVDKRAETEEGFRREIEIRLYVDSLSQDQLKSFGLKKKDRFAEQAIMFEVEDNGIGMNEVVKNRCLEPFYTTKEVGEGTGLGLSVTHSIVRELDFYLDIDSRENVGSLFRVIIPLQQDDHRV